MNRLFLIVLPLFLIISCTNHETRIRTLSEWMTGSFSSAAQAEADSNFYDISLTMTSIWTARSDGPWLYVEQAVTAMKDRPYRQRVYRLKSMGDDQVASEVYTLPGEKRFIGAGETPEILAGLTPDSLSMRSGCTVFLTWDEKGFFKGGTKEGDCASNLRGAAYATSLVEVYPDRLISWDRGYDAGGNQVWGAETGGYIFVKRTTK